MSLKPKCQGDKCTKTSQYNEGSSNFCVGCITTVARKHASHKKMEHHILSDITRGVRKALPYSNLTMRYDQVYHDDMRPDLQISNDVNDNIVMVEVDEKQHFTIENLKKDDARFKAFYNLAKEDGKSLSVVRVVPGENTKSSMFKKSGNSLYRNNGYLEKNPENYNKYIKESVSKIVRVINDKQSHRYRDAQASIGPTVKKNSSSPIFSDTSSPDVSPSTDRARAILADRIQKRPKNLPKNLETDFANLSINRSMSKPSARYPKKVYNLRDLTLLSPLSPPRLFGTKPRNRRSKTPSPKLERLISPPTNPKTPETPSPISSYFQYENSMKSFSPPPLPKKISPKSNNRKTQKTSKKSPDIFSFFGF